jgi:hypothetical protein
LLDVLLQGSHATAGFLFRLTQFLQAALIALDLLLDLLLPLLQLVNILCLRRGDHPQAPQQKEGEQPEQHPRL